MQDNRHINYNEVKVNNMAWYDDKQYDDSSYRKSVSSLRDKGYSVDSDGIYEPPEDKSWMQGGWVESDGTVHQFM